MRIGASLFLIAIGAILKFAVTKHVTGVDIQTVGLIVLIIGIVGLVVELILWGTRRRTTVVTRGAAGHVDPRMAGPARYAQPPVVSRTTYAEPRDPYDPV
jgi:hypothetical protein